MFLNKTIQKLQGVPLLIFFSVCTICLSGCSSFKEAMIQQIQAQSHPIDIEVQVGDGHRYIDLSQLNH